MRRQDPLNKKAGARGYVCKFGLDQSSLSWLSSIAVSLSARPAARRDLKFMRKCVQKFNVEMFAKKWYVTLTEVPKANKRHAHDYSCYT